MPRSLQWLAMNTISTLTRRVPLVEQKLPNLPEHLSSSQVFSRVRVAQLFVCNVLPIQVNYVRVSKYIVDSVRLITLFLLIYQMILKTFHHIYAYDMQKSLNIPER
jgi:hypothetical protein